MAFFQKNNMFTHLIQRYTRTLALSVSSFPLSNIAGFIDIVDVNFESMDTDDHDSDLSSTESQGGGRMADLSTPSYGEYSVAQLRELLRQRGQLTTGSRSALKKRLKNLDRQAAAKANSNNTQSATTTASSPRSTASTTTSSTNNTTSSPSPSTTTTATTTAQPVPEERTVQTDKGSIIMEMSMSEKDSGNTTPKRRTASRSNSFSAHFADFIKRRRDALETQRQEISVYTSPLTVLSYFVLYLLHEFRMALLWIVSRQYLLVIMPAVATLIYILYQTDGAHQPLLKHAESGLIWYGYWTLLGVASSIGLGTGLHTFVLFLGPHIAEVTLNAYACGNTDFDVRGDHRFICRSPVAPSTSDATIAAAAAGASLTFFNIFRAVQWESFFWGFGTALGELPPYFVARAAALSGDRNEELAKIEELIKKNPDQVTYKERILLMVHEGMKRLGFFGIFLCASIPNPLFDLAGITCGHFLIPFSTFFGATFLGKAVVKSSIQSMVVILMFSADTLATFMAWLEGSMPLAHGYLADGIKHQKGALANRGGGGDRNGTSSGLEDQLEDSTSLVGLIWNTIIFIMLSYFLLSIVETMALAQIKRRHEQELVELEGKIRSGDTKALMIAVSEEMSAQQQASRNETETISSHGRRRMKK
ncbi:Vacuolar membrane protease [Actinomortierella wolfii]|nr:Vacuolar membrane protease [Actinomortierella wolfii]